MGSWAKRVTWAQVVVLYVGTLVVGAAGIFLVAPVHTTATVPTHVEDPRDHPDRPAATQLTSVEVTCAGAFGLFESSHDRVLRAAGERGAPESYARDYLDRWQTACEAPQRRRDLLGLVGVVGGIVVTAAVVWSLRRRGPTVVAARPPPIELPDIGADGPPPLRCRRCTKVIPSWSTSPSTVLEGAVGLCRRCRIQRQAPSGIALLATSLALLVWGLALGAAGGADDLATWLVIGGSFTPLLCAQVAPHEAGHAIAAALARIRVPEVVVGVGPTVATFAVASTTLTIRAVPTSGVTVLPCTSTAGFRVRTWLAVAGGPAMSVAIIGLALRWDPGTGGLAATVRVMVIVTAAWILLVNLLPRELENVPGVSRTDGWHLVKVPFLSTDEVTTRSSATAPSSPSSTPSSTPCAAGRHRTSTTPIGRHSTSSARPTRGHACCGATCSCSTTPGRRPPTRHGTCSPMAATRPWTGPRC
ncbi:MAG: site-2 protease family protein [Acidimicrobiales bacterium]